MRTIRLLILFLILPGLYAFGQKSLPVYNKIPTEGLTLDSGWVYSAGDQPSFALSGFDDRQWTAINPVTPVYQLPQLQKSPVGWLRLHFRAGSALTGQPLCYNVWGNCASETYLDGRLIARSGTISHDPAAVVPLGMNPSSVLIRLADNQEHVLAIRFAVWRGAKYLRTEDYLLSPTIMTFSGYQANNSQMIVDLVFYVIYIAVFALLSILHLAFFRYDPKQKANLYFALYTLTSMLIFSMVALQRFVQDVRIYAWLTTPLFVINLPGAIFILYALGHLFRLEVKRWVAAAWIICAVLCADIVIIGLNYVYFFSGLALLTAIGLIIALKGLRAKKRGAAIISIGLLISIIANIAVAYRYGLMNAAYLDAGMFLRNLFDLVGTLSPAIAISVYLAREFSLDSILLREKLVEVELLSVQSLTLEREKQDILARQNDELEKQVTTRTAELQASLTDLKTAQGQLIQSAKMASLGELTAGIAHEIQNPLNFVNNFSEVNVELIEELKAELQKGDLTEAQAIAADLQENEQKINQHGRRADHIVKGMLEHSRTSAGQKEPTDLNKLADEYLRLAYHGLRAKDKLFNATLMTHFDENLPLTAVLPQDMGRVLLNLFNNAFYAVQQQAKAADSDYIPAITVTTCVSENHVLLTVHDNGIGIPAAILDKVMQPFFTTKPTGQGTGLGLSLSYDIVTKAHGGQLTVTSAEGQYTQFEVILPF